MLEHCPACGCKVVRMADGMCPSCRAITFVSDPEVSKAAPPEAALESAASDFSEPVLRKPKPEILLLNAAGRVGNRMRLVGCVLLVAALGAAVITFCFSPWVALAYLTASLGGLLLIQTGFAFTEYADGGRTEDCRTAFQALDRLVTYQFVVLVAGSVPVVLFFWTIARTVLAKSR